MAQGCPWGVGAKTSTLIAFEEEYGVLPEDYIAYNIPFNTNGVAASQNTTDPATIRGDRNPVEGIYGNVTVDGDIAVPVDYFAYGVWLKACFDEPETESQYTLIGRFKLTDSAVAAGCKISKEGFYDGSDTIAWEDVNTGWSTYSTNFESDTNGDVYRYTLLADSSEHTCFGKPEVGSYKHVYKIGMGMPSFTMEKRFPGIGQYLYSHGCKVSKLSLQTGGDGELVSTISVVGAKEVRSDTSFAPDAKVESTEFHRALNFQAALKINGEIQGKITNVTLDVDFGVDTEGYCIGGGGYREAACDGICNVSGSMEAFFADGRYIEYAQQSEKISVEIVFTHGNGEVLSFKMPELKFALSSPPIDGPAGIKQTLNFNAFYDNSEEKSAIVVTLENDKESY